MTFPYQNLEMYRGLPERLSIGVSGGRSSAYQAAHILKANEGNIPDTWIFSFENTALERPETYDFLDRFEDELMAPQGVKLHRLEFHPDAPNRVRVVDRGSTARNGEPFELLLNTPLLRRDGTVGVRPLPNPTQRTCTATLKIKTVHRFLRHYLKWPMQYYSVIGYRSDEMARMWRKWLLDERKGFDEGGIGIFPMCEAGVNDMAVYRFWKSMPFDLELDSDFGNCDFCFMASTWKIKQRMILVALETQTKIRPGAIPPERIARWIAWEERDCDRSGTFRKDRPTIRQLWNQVCEGNYESAMPEGKEDRCGSCTD